MIEGQQTLALDDQPQPRPVAVVPCASAELTDDQRTAVATRDRSLVLTATAGSGKTRVLVERFACAVLDDGIAPERILAITFTEKAAQELLARVRARLAELGQVDAARDSEAGFISTIHGFCARVLRTNPLAAGLDPDFAVCDDAAAKRLRRRAFELALGAFFAGETPIAADRALDVVAGFGLRRLETAIDSVHERLRSRGQRTPGLPLEAATDDPEARELATALDALLAAHAAAYRRLKRAESTLDYDDLELETLALLGADDSLRAAWSERFELIMVDEFQDTNPRQAALLDLLERDNLFVVGDEFQSIYGFRFADPQLFAARRDALAARGQTAQLADNFRSRPPLLDTINAAFAQRFGDDFIALRAARGDDRPGESRVELLISDCSGWDGVDLGPGAAGGASSWRRAEARLLARRVAELVTEGAAPGETLVLLRAGTSMAIYERALNARGLRTVAVGGGFWTALEISDLLVYLRALANPHDVRALCTLLGSPLVGASADALALLGLAVGRLRRDPYWVLRDAFAGGDAAATAALEALDAADRERLAAFVACFDAERRHAPRLPLDVLLTRGLEISGYAERVGGYGGGDRRIANVSKLLRLARRFEAREGRDLRRFLEHIAALRATQPREPEAPVIDAAADAIRLMTIHGAKGLEADLVCVADLGRARGNGDKPYVLADGDRLGICVPQRDGSFAEALDYAALRNELRDAETAEEDRVLYVALTRARERLLLSGAVDVGHWPRESRTSAPLTWLGPALVPDIAARLVGQAARGGGEVAVDDVQPRLRLVLNSPALAAPPDAGAVIAAGHGQPASAPRPWRAPPPPMPPPAAPRSLSYSALSDYGGCGYRYYLQRVLGLPDAADAALAPTAAGGGLDGRARGSIVHNLLERLDFADPAPPAADAVAAAAARIGATATPADVDQLRGLVAAFARSPLCGRLAGATDVRREQPFAFVLAAGESARPPLVNGFFDVIARESDGTALVVDYKTDQTGDAHLEQLTVGQYEPQRLIYALAALCDGATRVEVAHCYLERPDELVSARFETGDADSLHDRIGTLAAGIAAGSFEVSAAPHRGLCAGCPARARLCSWELDVTGREPSPAARGAAQDRLPR